MSLKTGLLAVCSLTALGTGIAAAQIPPADARGSGVENIVVTAQKRSQRLQKVPLAITVVNDAQLRRQQIETVQDLSLSAAAVEFAPTSNSPGGGATVRGIGTETFQAGAQPSVGIVLDGVPLGNLNTNNLFDIARVEIIPGPQGMLYGSSTSAGVINITTNAPDPRRFGGYVHADIAPFSLGADYHGIGNEIVNAVLNIPITPVSALRISAFGNYLQGLYHDNYSGKDSDNVDQGVRVHYLARPNDRVTINIIGDYEKINTHGYQLFVAEAELPTTSPFGGPSQTQILADCGITPSRSNNKDCSQFGVFTRQTNRGASAQIDYTLGDATITNIASYREQQTGPEFEDIYGYGPEQVPSLSTPSSQNYAHQITEELRLASPSTARLEYTVGGYFSDYIYNNGSAPLQIALPFATLLSGTTDHTRIESGALFGQITYHVTPRLRLIAGGRLQQESITDQATSTTTPNPFAPPLVLQSAGSATIDNASWRLGGQYDVMPRTMVYFTATRGYKGPQISDSNPLVPARIIQPELPLDFELGVKSSAFDDRLGVNVTLFHTDVKNFQGQNCAFTPAIVCTPINVSSVLTQGVQIDTFGRPLPALTVNGSLLFDDVTYPSGYLGADGSVLGSATLVNATRFKATFSGEYVWDLASSAQIYLDGNAVYKSDVRSYPSSRQIFTIPAHWNLGAKLGWRAPDRAWGAALFVRNLLDFHEPVQIYDNNPGAVYVLGPQSTRLVGLSLDAKF